MAKIKSLVALAVTAGLLMTGVTASQAAGKTLTLGARIDVVNYAASQGEYGNRAWYYQAVYDTLLRKKEDATVIPGLAKSWSYNGDQTVLTLKLREGQKFTDGTAEDAAAVVKNLYANRDSKGPAANYLASMDKAVAKDKNTVVITLTDSDPALLENLAETAGLVQSPKTIGSATEKTNPVGAGPYTLVAAQTKFGDHYTYKANPKYWDAKNVKYSTLVIKPISDQTAMVNALTTGAIQGAVAMPTAKAQLLKVAGMKVASQYLDCAGIYLADRTGKLGSPLNNVKVRQAMNLVFDRQAMVNAVVNGLGKPTNQYFPSASKAYITALDNTYKYDVDAAKKLMADAGYADGFTLSMPTVSWAFGTTAYAIIKAQLAKINITVDEQPQAGATFISDIQKPKWPAYFMTFERSINTWKMLNFMVTDNSLFNNDRYSDSTLAGLIGRYHGATSDASRLSVAKSINTYLVKQALFVPLYEIESEFAYKGISLKGPQAGNVIPYLYNIK